MRMQRLGSLWFSTLACMHLGAHAVPAVADTISLRADVWCPFNCEPGSERPGYMVDIARAAFEEAGHTINYENTNWARAIAETRKGTFNAIIAAAKNDAPDFIFPNEHFGVSKNCFFTPSTSTWLYKGVESLPSVLIGAIHQYSYGDPFDTYLNKGFNGQKRVDFVSGDYPLKLNMNKLLENRVGAIIEEENVLKNFLFKNNIPPAKIRKAGCIKEDRLYIAFSPKNPKSQEFAQILSKKIERMRSKGELQKQLDIYGISDWTKATQ